MRAIAAAILLSTCYVFQSAAPWGSTFGLVVIAGVFIVRDLRSDDRT